MTTGLTLEGPGVVAPFGTPRSTEQVAALVRAAAARGTRLRVVAGGHWLDAGHPVDADATLPVGALDGIVDYVPGDLTLTARAGTSLDTIMRATAAEGQGLTLDPPGAETGTLGATVATASAGPLAHAFGTPRDLVLGATFVDGNGNVVRGGGRLVKNVAGFDLVRLVTGAWGTLGVITEVSVRLRALPEVDATVALALPARLATRLESWLAELRAASGAAWALELVNGPLAEQVGLGAPFAARGALLVRLGGNEPLVRAQRAALTALGDPTDVDAGVWARLRAGEPRVATVARLSVRPTRLAALCADLFSPAARAVGLLAHASVARGIVRFILPGATGFGLPRLDVAPAGDFAPTLIVERMPAAVRAALGARLMPPRADDVLSQRLRAAFDPRGILNPGILG